MSTPVTHPAVRAWRLLSSGPRSGVENMRLDEELLRNAAAGERVPILRFYTWTPPAVSLGRFQDELAAIDAGACGRLGIDVVRRITGGRAVLHDRELTYSVASRADNPLFPNDILGTYKVIARGLLAGLANLGIRAEIVSRSCRHAALVRKRAKEPSCFASPSWYEILADGMKIIGSAQRRVPGAFLQHGSILIGRDPALEAAVIRGGSGDRVTCIAAQAGGPVSAAEAQEAFARGFSDALGIEFVPE